MSEKRGMYYTPKHVADQLGITPIDPASGTNEYLIGLQAELASETQWADTYHREVNRLQEENNRLVLEIERLRTPPAGLPLILAELKSEAHRMRQSCPTSYDRVIELEQAIKSLEERYR